MIEKRYTIEVQDWEYFHIKDNLTGELLGTPKDFEDLLNKQTKDIQILFMDKKELENALARRERKIKEILQRHYDAKLGNDRIIETIAEDLSVELDLW